MADAVVRTPLGRSLGYGTPLLLALVLVPLAAAQSLPEGLTPEVLTSIPAPQPTMVRPRVLAAYGALLTAATLGILYLYRGRDFILYWVATWLLLAAALAIVSQSYTDLRLAGVMVGLALLLVVWSAGLVLLGRLAFPVHALRWSVPVRVAAGTAVWFLAAPFAMPLGAVIWSGTALTLILLGVAAHEYLHLARRARYAGALMIGVGLGVVVVSNVLGAAVLLDALPGGAFVNRIAIGNVVTTVLVAFGMHVLVFEDMTDELRRTNRELGAANEEVKRLAITDPLTGCHNRRFFDEIERREMQRHRRYEAPLSVVFVDVDHFKQLNDTRGHDTGDELLRTIGALLRRLVRESDYVIRWGGDEFLLLMNCGLPEAQRKAAELKFAFEREPLRATLPASVGLSIGVAGVTKEAESLRDAIRDADAQMYRDKLTERAEPGAL
jgi:diguanylate cyclase (GGDEF)-like protein